MQNALPACCLCKTVGWIVKHGVRRECIWKWCNSDSWSSAHHPTHGELPQYLHLGHCFELCNTLISLAALFAFTHWHRPPGYNAANAKRVCIFTCWVHVTGNKTPLEPWLIGWRQKQFVESNLGGTRVWNCVFIAQCLQQYSHIWGYFWHPNKED